MNPMAKFALVCVSMLGMGGCVIAPRINDAGMGMDIGPEPDSVCEVALQSGDPAGSSIKGTVVSADAYWIVLDDPASKELWIPRERIVTLRVLSSPERKDRDKDSRRSGHFRGRD